MRWLLIFNWPGGQLHGKFDCRDQWHCLQQKQNICRCSKEVIWMRRFMEELGYPQPTSVIYEDNRGAKALSENDLYHARTKHIDVRYHFIRDNLS